MTAHYYRNNYGRTKQISQKISSDILLWLSWVGDLIRDSISTYLVGPVYIWTNIRMPIPFKSEASYARLTKVLALGNFLRQKSISGMLKKINTEEKVLGMVEGIWFESLSYNSDFNVVSEFYQYQEMVGDLCELVYSKCRELKLISYTDPCDDPRLCDLLNDAWKKFYSTPSTYHEWETETISKLYTALACEFPDFALST